MRPLRSDTLVGVAALLAFVCGPASAAPGDLDFSFGTQGIALSSIGDQGVTAMTLQADGKILTTTLADVGADRATLRITRFTTGGDVDPSFGSAGVAALQIPVDSLAVVRAMLRQANDNRIVVAGRSVDAFALTRLTPAGGVDSGFGTGGTVTTTVRGDDEVFAVAQQTDLKLLAAGRADDGRHADFAIVRYTTGGVPDGTFSGDGIQTVDFGGDDTAHAIALQEDGSILVAGVSQGTSSNLALTRLTPTGALDPDFGVGGKVTTSITAGDDVAWSVLVQANGKVVVAGEADDDFMIARYSTDGALDPGFGTGGVTRTNVSPGTRDYARALVRQGDGKFVVAGVANPARASDFALLRYTAGGQPDASFGSAGIVTTSVAASFGEEVTTLLLQGEGKLLTGGLSEDGTTTYQMISRHETGAATASCGNGVPEGNEQCDDGNTDDTDSCLHTCVNASCGDGFVRDGIEECDDGNTSNGDSCSSDCQTEALCGDADGNGQIQASDALRVLRKAVGQPVTCEPSICDVNANGSVQAGDALAVLRAAVGQPVVLTCSPTND